jgi:hypothetical protein
MILYTAGIGRVCVYAAGRGPLCQTISEWTRPTNVSAHAVNATKTNMRGIEASDGTSIA